MAEKRVIALGKGTIVFVITAAVMAPILLFTLLTEGNPGRFVPRLILASLAVAAIAHYVVSRKGQLRRSVSEDAGTIVRAAGFPHDKRRLIIVIALLAVVAFLYFNPGRLMTRFLYAVSDSSFSLKCAIAGGNVQERTSGWGPVHICESKERTSDAGTWCQTTSNECEGWCDGDFGDVQPGWMGKCSAYKRILD